jgi:DNA-binding transcriptional MerR regulator
MRVKTNAIWGLTTRTRVCVMAGVVTSNADRVISNESAEPGVAAADAHAIARITYRQLDHWARQGWVRPSIDEGQGRAGRRRYSRADVVRLDLLRHLGKSGVNLTTLGPVVAGLAMPDPNQRVLWGPLGVRDDEPEFMLVPDSDVTERVERAGSWVVYSAARVNTRFDEVVGKTTDLGPGRVESNRRSA